MSRYRFLAYGLVSNTQITELPLTAVTYGRVLNGAGALSASLRLPEPTDIEARLLATDYIAGTNPARAVIYVERDGVLIDGYIVWTRSYDSDSRTLTLVGAGLWSYFRRRRIRYDYSTTGDQLTHAQLLVWLTQLYAGGDIGVAIGTETSGVSRTYAWTAQQAKKVAEAVEDIADNYPGFDFSIDVAYETEVPVRRFRCWYPRKGRTAAFTGHVFELGRNITSLTWPEDASRTANTIIGLGAGTGETMVTADAAEPSLFDDGYPLLEDDVSFKDVTDPATLARHAQSALEDVRVTAALPKLVIRGDLDPELGSFTEGDDCRIRVQPQQDPRWPDGLEKYTRITAWEATVPDDGGAEEVTLTVQEVAA